MFACRQALVGGTFSGVEKEKTDFMPRELARMSASKKKLARLLNIRNFANASIARNGGPIRKITVKKSFKISTSKTDQDQYRFYLPDKTIFCLSFYNQSLKITVERSFSSLAGIKVVTIAPYGNAQWFPLNTPGVIYTSQCNSVDIFIFENIDKTRKLVGENQ